MQEAKSLEAAAPRRRLSKDYLLLHFDLATGVFKLLLGGIGVGLVGAFEDRLGSALDERLGFGQTQSGLHFPDAP